MPADTPALPGAAPDPSATPRLDALLRNVEQANGPTGNPLYFKHAAPRLAAIVRVLVEALTKIDRASDQVGFAIPLALARAEAIAKGEA